MKRVLFWVSIVIVWVVLALAFVALLLRPGRSFNLRTEQSAPIAERHQKASLTALEYMQKSETAYLFPIVIKDTPLVVKSLAQYEGNMLENDSDEHLSDAAALELFNASDRALELVSVQLRFGQRKMEFFGTNIPPQSTVLIIEQSGADWTDAYCTECSGWVQYSQMKELPANALSVEEVDMGTVAVTNTLPYALNNVWLFYKNYLYESELYLGGITYTEQIDQIESGETILIHPSRYASGYSKVIKFEVIG